jgi:adenylate kinase
MQKQVIILFGPPGAGKGTQSELLKDKLGYYYFETSKILEETFKREGLNKSFEIEGKTYSIKDEKELWLTGILCSPPFVTQLIKEKIKGLFDQDKSLVIAGSPRTVYEGERVVPFLKDLYKKENIKFVLIELSPEQTIYRNSHRRICELIRHPILYSEETKDLEICPIDGSKLVRRKGLDDPETIKVRLNEYKERTLPLVELFEKNGIMTKKINGEQSVADVHKDILIQIL